MSRSLTGVPERASEGLVPPAPSAVRIRAWQAALAFGLIALVTLVVHWRTFEIANLGDTGPFFEDTKGVDDLGDLILRFSSYNRVRESGKGDTLIYRPGVFVWLSLGKRLLGQENQAAWQAVSLGMHLLVCLALYLFLLRIWPGWPSILATLWFSVLGAGDVVVIYAHVAPFSLALLLAMGALFLVHGHAEGGHAGQGHAETAGNGAGKLILAALALAVAAFILEIFAVLAVAAGAYLAWTGARKRGAGAGLVRSCLRPGLHWAFFAAALVYFGVDAWDYVARYDYIRVAKARASLDSFGQILNLSTLPDTLYHFVRLFDLWIVRGIFPYFHGTLYYPLLALGLWSGVRAARGRGWGARRVWAEFTAACTAWLTAHPFAALMFVCALAIALVYILARVNLRGTTYAREAPFYAYHVWVFVLIGAADLLRKVEMPLLRGRKAVATVLFLALVVVPNIFSSQAVTDDFARRFPAPVVQSR